MASPVSSTSTGITEAIPGTIPQSIPSISLRLNRSNYLYWKSQVLPAARAHQLDRFLLGTSPAPVMEVSNPDDPSVKIVNPSWETWNRLDQFVVSWLLASMTKGMLRHVIRYSTASEIWFALESLFATQSRARVPQLRHQLQTMKKGSMSIDDYVLKMKNVADSLLAAGQSLDEDELILYILGGLGQEYEAAVINLTSRKDSLTLSEVQYMLQTRELCLEHQLSVSSVDVFSPTANYVQSSFNFSRGREFSARGSGFSNRGSRGSGFSNRGSGFANRGSRGSGFSNRGSRGSGFSNRGSRGSGFANGGSRGSGFSNRGSRGSGFSNRGSRGSGFANRGSRGSGFANRGSRGRSRGSHPTCQVCGKFGHSAYKCYHRFDESYQGSVPVSSPQAYVAGVASPVAPSSSASSSPDESWRGSRLTCQVCGKFGHSAYKCYHRFDESYQGSVPVSSPQAYAAGVASPVAPSSSASSSPDESWFLDSGATNHVVNAFDNMSVHTPYKDTENLVIEEKSKSRCRNEEHEESPIHLESKLCSQSHDQAQIEPIEELKSSVWEQETQNALHVNIVEANFAVFESMEIENTDNSLVFHCGPVNEQDALPKEKNPQFHDIDGTQEIEVAEEEVADVNPPPDPHIVSKTKEESSPNPSSLLSTGKEMMMSVISNKITKEELKSGDHIYSWRTAYIYSHHGIYVGDEKVIHFTRGAGQEIGTGTVLDRVLFSSAPHSSDTPCPVCGDQSKSDGVMSSCLDCFLSGGELYRFQYDTSPVVFLAKPRGGTCTLAKSDPPEDVIYRAEFLLKNGFGDYHIFSNNCEDFAIYCKTGLLVFTSDSVGRSGQASSFVAAVRTAVSTVVSSPRRFLTISVYDLATGYGKYCVSRLRSDIGVRRDVIKIPVERLVTLWRFD